MKSISSQGVFRNYGKIIYDIYNQHSGVFPIKKLRFQIVKWLIMIDFKSVETFFNILKTVVFILKSISLLVVLRNYSTIVK